MSEMQLPPPPPSARAAEPVSPAAPFPAPQYASPQHPLSSPPRPRRALPRGVGTILTAVVAAVLATTTTLVVTGATRPPADVETAEAAVARPSNAPVATTTPTASAAPTASAQATPTPAPTSAPAAAAPSSASSSLPAVIARAQKSVVTVDVQGVATFGRGGYGVQTSGVGSGVIVSSDGYILTAQHVVEGATAITVTLENGSTHDATVVATSSSQDVALLKISATGLTAAPIARGAPVVGTQVLVLGNPLGQYADSVSMGIISGTDRSIQVADMTTRAEVTRSGLIQTDAAVNEGNSGGPLMDTQGRVHALATATATNAQGLGFATPVSAAVPLLSKAGVAYSS
jgi:S1-C subfamily serine protease